MSSQAKRFASRAVAIQKIYGDRAAANYLYARNVRVEDAVKILLKRV